MLLPFCTELLNTPHGSHSVCAQRVCAQQYEVFSLRSQISSKASIKLIQTFTLQGFQYPG